MNLRNLLWRAPAPAEEPANPVDASYAEAMQVAGEVKNQIRERAQSANPFRKVLAEMLLGHPDDPALIADAFEVTQEARIFHGPANGRL